MLQITISLPSNAAPGLGCITKDGAPHVFAKKSNEAPASAVVLKSKGAASIALCAQAILTGCSLPVRSTKLHNPFCAAAI